MPDDPKDPTVKELLARPPGEALAEVDAATAADLARWFGLPSVAEVVERGDVPGFGLPGGLAEAAGAGADEDDARRPGEPVSRAQHARRVAAALAAVDARIVDRVFAQAARDPLPPPIELRLAVERPLDRLDAAMAARAVAEPRDLERPDDLRDALKTCTPQALLRDLHRIEAEYARGLERLDLAATEVVDARALAREAMRRRDAAPDPQGDRRAALGLLDETRQARRRPWQELPAALGKGAA